MDGKDIALLKSCLKFKASIKSRKNFKWITLRLKPNEMRFGFNVIGGFDEYLPAKVEAIAPGMCFFIVLLFYMHM